MMANPVLQRVGRSCTISRGLVADAQALLRATRTTLDRSLSVIERVRRASGEENRAAASVAVDAHGRKIGSQTRHR